MSQFYGSVQGNRGTASRLGTKKSGVVGHIRGWDIGCQVWMRFNEKTQQDECTIDLTDGSYGCKTKRIGVFTMVDIEKE